MGVLDRQVALCPGPFGFESVRRVVGLRARPRHYSSPASAVTTPALKRDTRDGRPHWSRTQTRPPAPGTLLCDLRGTRRAEGRRPPRRSRVSQTCRSAKKGWSVERTPSQGTIKQTLSQESEGFFVGLFWSSEVLESRFFKGIETKTRLPFGTTTGGGLGSVLPYLGSLNEDRCNNSPRSVPPETTL